MPLETGTYRLFGRRATLAYLNTIAPAAARLVGEHFGRRPLATTQILLTTPTGLGQLFRSTQAGLAGVSENTADPAMRLMRAEPRQLYSTTTPRPGKAGGTLTLINARRNRHARDLEESLLYELVAVDQLGRPKARERWITVVRDLCGVAPQPPHVRKALEKDFAAADKEAARVVEALAPRLRDAA
ncbi:hypothetical protein ACFYZH_31940 [Streptomyces abikoensis]|uniref:hypothetical protein n=1 Tax=Streptomyces abikoensis TaxID=97398 RepID=UPI0036CCE3B0